VRGRAQQQGVSVAGTCGHGAGTDGDAGHVEERLVSQTAATLLGRRDQALFRQGEIVKLSGRRGSTKCLIFVEFVLLFLC